MSAWLDRLVRLREDAGPPSDANYQWQANKHAAETYIGFDGCPEFLAAAANLWSLLVATIQAADRWNGAGTDREDGQRAWVEITGSLTALRAEVEKLS